ncbi:hypothetical protein GCM10009745_70560 [Kribbella yunnanensis]|uniref:OmpR/PhoB-type domain-containing protein n=1 Tax=Kribbella yunnanensis TaxID=190194 RepID=A0ABP4UXL5_9ACTN
MEIRLLGKVEVRVGDSVLDVDSSKQRLVFAVLAATPGQVVPLEVLIDRVWGEDLPARPAATLYAYLSQLRGVLSTVGGSVVRRSGGYACEVPPECVDVSRSAN